LRGRPEPSPTTGTNKEGVAKGYPFFIGVGILQGLEQVRE
jgi:hypothetical protein